MMDRCSSGHQARNVELCELCKLRRVCLECGSDCIGCKRRFCEECCLLATAPNAEGEPGTFLDAAGQCETCRNVELCPTCGVRECGEAISECLPCHWAHSVEGFGAAVAQLRDMAGAA